MTGYIYQLKNKINGKSYIGQTINIHERILKHLNNLKENNHYNKKLQADFNDVGEDNFEVKYWAFEDIDEKELDELEKKYIKKYDSIENGYNTLEGGRKPPLHKKVDDEKLLICLCIMTYNEQCGRPLENILGYAKSTLSSLKRRTRYLQVWDKFDALTEEERQEISKKYFKEWNVEEERYKSIKKRGNGDLSRKTLSFTQKDFNIIYAAREEGYGYTCVAKYYNINPATVKDWMSGRARSKNLNVYKSLSLEEKEEIKKEIPRKELELLENEREKYNRLYKKN